MRYDNKKTNQPDTMTVSDNPHIRMINRNCMEAMKGMEDNAYELAIVDPPYAVGASDGSFGNRGYDSSTSNLKHYANADEVPKSRYFHNLFYKSINQIIWGSNYYPDCLYHSGAIVWHKKNDGPLSDCEIAFQSFDKKVKYYWHEWQGFLKGRESGTTRIHPNQKPVALYKWLLKNYATEGDRILDTHGGSGSIAIACYDMGFDLDWYELDEDYYNDAVSRFQEHKSQRQLFTPEEQYETAKQGELI